MERQTITTVVLKFAFRGNYNIKMITQEGSKFTRYYLQNPNEFAEFLIAVGHNNMDLTDEEHVNYAINRLTPDALENCIEKMNALSDAVSKANGVEYEEEEDDEE
jgi:hypothetical protein